MSGRSDLGAKTLGRVLEHLGSTLLSLEAGEFATEAGVSSVVMLDPLDPPQITAGAIVLGVGVAGADDTAAQVRSAGARGAVALVVKTPTMSQEVIDAVAEAKVALLGLVRGASWIQVATMLTSVLDVGEQQLGGHFGSDAAAELFELANTVAGLLQAPITIEDLSSRVVAFSSDQAGTDEPRRQTILGLRVPDVYGTVQRADGVFRRVYSSETPVYLPSVVPGSVPRVAMRVKAGEEVLGSIWAVVDGPLSDQRTQGLIEGAGVIALTMLRARVASDSNARLRIALVSRLLEGGVRAREAADQLNLAGSSACVIAIAPRSSLVSDTAADEAELHRVAGTLNMYLQPTHPRAVSALLDGVIYAIVPFWNPDDGSWGQAAKLARDFVDRVEAAGVFLAGVGPIVDSASELPASRSDADGALRVLRNRAHDGDRVSALADVQVEWLMLQLADALAASRVEVSGPLALLRAYDAEHDTELVDSLRAWLDNFGDVAATARMMHVHTNTFRYRLTRIAELGLVDLADANIRFGLMLQLRLFS